MKINYAFIAFEEVRHDEFKQYMRMKAIFYFKGTTTGWCEERQRNIGSKWGKLQNWGSKKQEHLIKQICFVTKMIHDFQTIHNNGNLLAIKLYWKNA